MQAHCTSRISSLHVLHPCLCSCTTILTVASLSFLAAACLLQPNQLPIEDLHIDFNERLWSLTQRIFQKDGWYQQDKTLEGADFRYDRSQTDIHGTPDAAKRVEYVRPAETDVMGKMKRK